VLFYRLFSMLSSFTTGRHSSVCTKIDVERRVIMQHLHSPGGDNFTCNIVRFCA